MALHVTVLYIFIDILNEKSLLNPILSGHTQFDVYDSLRRKKVNQKTVC